MLRHLPTYNISRMRSYKTCDQLLGQTYITGEYRNFANKQTITDNFKTYKNTKVVNENYTEGNHLICSKKITVTGIIFLMMLRKIIRLSFLILYTFKRHKTYVSFDANTQVKFGSCQHIYSENC